ncbi:MAG: hypothetical protein AAGA27_05600 [Pseudomonadota bacterium]
MSKISIKNIKEVSIDFINRVKSGQFSDQVKHGFDAFQGNRNVLPKHLRAHLKALDSNIAELIAMQKQLEEKIYQCKRELANFCSDLVVVYDKHAPENEEEVIASNHPDRTPDNKEN